MGSQFDLACKLNLTYYFLVCLEYIFLLLLSACVFFSAFSGCMNFFSCEFFMYGFFFSPLPLLFQWSTPQSERSMEGVLPAKQESWVLSELDKKKGELTRAIGARGRMFWHVH